MDNLTSSRQTKNILIADPDESFLMSMKADSIAQKFLPFLVADEISAKSILMEKALSFFSILLNPEIAPPQGLSLIRLAHEHHPATAIYLVTEKQISFLPEDMHQLGIQKIFQKPFTVDQLLDEFTPRLPIFDPSAALELAARYQGESTDAEILAEDSKYSPIRAADFLAGTVSYFDIYARLRSGRYLKLLQAGDSFSLDRISNYLKKGLTYFYIRREVQEHYLTYCDQVTFKILNQNKPELFETATAQTLNHGEETLRAIRKLGVSEGTVSYAKDFLRNVSNLTTQLQLNRNSLIENFLNDLTAYEHAASVTLISSILVRSLDIVSANPVESVGLASFLHDIGMKVLNLDLVDEDETYLSNEEKKSFLQHPIAGANYLKTIRGLNPIVCQAVAQHHERRNKKGFPHHIGAGSLSMASEIVGLSNEFHEILVKTRSNPNIDFKEQLKTRIFSAFSPSLVTEFKKVFLSHLKDQGYDEEQ